MSEFPTPNGPLWVRYFGVAPAVVVALHGFTLHGGMFADVAHRLQKTIAAPDLPGHGRSRIEPISMASAVDAVAELLGSLAARPILVGYSQGARIAMQTALIRPELIAAMLVISGSPGLSGRARRLRQAADDGLASRIEQIGVERFIDEWLARPMTSTDAVDVQTRIADRNIRLENSAAGLAAALRGMGQGCVSDASGRLASLNLPTLFMAGANDDKYSRFAAAMAESRGDRPLIVPNAGHNVVLEAPEAVTAAIRQLLSLQNP